MSLLCAAYVSEVALGVGGKLLSRGLCILRSFLHHVLLYLVESGKFIAHVAAVFIADDGYALLHQFSLSAHQLSHLVYVSRSHGDDAGSLVSIVHYLIAVIVSLAVGNHSRIDAYLLVADTGSLEESHHFSVLLLQQIIHHGRVVAYLFVRQRPCHLVGFHLSFRQTFHHHCAVAIFESHDAISNAHTHDYHAHGSNHCSTNNSFCLHRRKCLVY